ncbi:MAG: hypothetical protein ABW080_08740 [Candidatus Thiodiazotropha sp.]
MSRHANNQAQQTILITGSTDGIGLKQVVRAIETILADSGH